MLRWWFVSPSQSKANLYFFLDRSNLLLQRRVRGQARKMQFSGFLSYSHRDESVASSLARRLERWRVPRRFRRETGIDRIRIFRDIEDAELGELSEVICRAIEVSDHLILICSPASRCSTYVALEIESFAAIHGPAAILPVLVAGRPNSEVVPGDPTQDQAFPDALLSLYKEPLAADLRPRPNESRAKNRTYEREAFFQIVARLLGIPKSDELVRRDRFQRRLRVGVVAAALVIASTLSWWAWWDARPKPGLDPFWRLTASTLDDRDVAALVRLEGALTAAIPPKVPDDRLLIATWNIRDFKLSDTARISRGPAEFTMIAALLSRFDIVAVQEMKGSDSEFAPARDAVLARLGRHWAYVGSGVTAGNLGNNERLGFFYDRRSVAQNGGIDELILTGGDMETSGLNRQFARTPIVADFDLGETRLKVANAHVVWGSNDSTEIERAREFNAILTILRSIGEREAVHVMLLGDLNFSAPSVPQVEIAAEHGYHFPPGLLAASTSFNLDRPYDQIVLGWPPATSPLVTRSGAFPIFDHIYRKGDLAVYHDRLTAIWPDAPGSLEHSYLMQWRTRMISDHNPKWIELDFGKK